MDMTLGSMQAELAVVLASVTRLPDQDRKGGEGGWVRHVGWEGGGAGGGVAV